MKLLLQKKNLVFSTLLLIVVVIQFLFLNSIPPGMKHDEIEYALSSKTYALFGQDISGTPFPLSLIKTDTLGRISPIPPLFLSPVWLLIPMTQETVRVLYVLLAIGIGVLTSYLAFILFKDKRIAAVTLLFFLINPWEYFLSRFAVDPSFALFFYLLGIILLLRFNGPLLIFAFLAFILGFFSYNAAKLLLIPIVILCLVYRLSNKTNIQRKRPLFEVLFLSCILVFFFLTFLVSKFIPGTIVSNRLEEIVFFNSGLLSSSVDTFRSQTIASPITGLFINKVTESLRLFLEHYLAAFSPLYLFVSGDPNSLLGFYYHGLFYWIDALFILFAFFYLARKQKKIFFFLLGLILIAPVAMGASTIGIAIVTRTFLLLPLLVILSAYGAVTGYALIRKSSYKKLYIGSIVLILSVSYINFLNYYFLRQPVIAQENFVTSERVIAKYISLASETNTPVIVVHPEPRQLYLQTVFYSKPERQTELLKNNKEAFLQQKYVIDNVQFESSCPNVIDPNKTYIVGSNVKDCMKKQKTSYYLARKQDSGQIFKIVNGQVCNNITLSKWMGNHKLSDFEIEEMDNKTFCTTWFIKYD